MKEIMPYEVEQLLKHKPVIVDVRELSEWMTNGHIPGAIHIPLGQLEEKAAELDRTADIIVVCRSGSRSEAACEWLQTSGYRAYNMKGGMSSWFWDKAYGS